MASDGVGDGWWMAGGVCPFKGEVIARKNNFYWFYQVYLKFKFKVVEIWFFSQDLCRTLHCVFFLFIVKTLLNWGGVLCAKIGLGIRMRVKSSRTPSSIVFWHKSMSLPKVKILRKIHYKVCLLEVKHIAYVRIYIEEMDSQFDVSWNSRLGLPTTCCSKPFCHWFQLGASSNPPY